jgi:ABC-type multidrug transport system ATPase subunit
MEQHFLDKQEIIRLLLVSVAAGEHMLLIGSPGTAKSALVRMFAQLIDARYFEYLLTRFTEPNEIFGPVDIAAFREGHYRRNTAGMLPEDLQWIRVLTLASLLASWIPARRPPVGPSVPRRAKVRLTECCPGTLTNNGGTGPVRPNLGNRASESSE